MTSFNGQPVTFTSACIVSAMLQQPGIICPSHLCPFHAAAPCYSRQTAALAAYESCMLLQHLSPRAKETPTFLLFTCRACYGVLRFIMESGAKGCEVIVSGKLRAQRAKAMKFKDGYMISSGQPVNDFIDSAVRHVLLRQGVLGIKVGSQSASPPF
jgi:hypothetical protein